ncbi:transcriptional repressor [Aestuariibacter sp. AA17]|uniref:Transcriptional repressor n=1 Tax=Fluctibacter corallii TaxID=2984329 RepID=A0ABT3A680_9ALTE|nr:transcriptional repressor [Aestuariibacter sp. AA17]MCV2884174.1 transcriptional repressor [Aestuariibacter sp. AA17]
MKQEKMRQALSAAKHRCDEMSKKLTQKRMQILEVLLEGSRPMSAYELTDAYNDVAEHPIKAMSVYRILDFLVSVQLVHHLRSANKFMACNLTHGSHIHQLSFFLICTCCQRVEETEASQNIVDALRQHIDNTQFSLMNSQFELTGLCRQCQQKRTEGTNDSIRCSRLAPDTTNESS